MQLPLSNILPLLLLWPRGAEVSAGGPPLGQQAWDDAPRRRRIAQQRREGAGVAGVDGVDLTVHERTKQRSYCRHQLPAAALSAQGHAVLALTVTGECMHY